MNVPPDQSKSDQNRHGETTWQDARKPLALAIDIGSSSVRALMFDARGFQVDRSEHQLPYRLHTTRDGASQADPELVFELVCECIDRALELAADHAGEIGAVATSSYWHSLMGVDSGFHATSPVYMWSDTRAGSEVERLRALVDAHQMHLETGCRFHSSYWPAKLLWLQQTQPEIVAETATWCSFADYVDVRLRQSVQTSISMASGTGFMRIADASWHEPLIETLEIPLDRFPELVDRHTPLPDLTTSWRARWSQLAGVPWFPAIGDGAAANLGTGAVGSDRIAITIGTSGAMRLITDDDQTPAIELSDRIWSYRLDRTHRVTGGALSNGGNVAGWLARYLAGGDFERITDEAAAVSPDGHGLTVLPLLAGERSPSWNDHASGVFAGLTLATRPGHVYRAALEATAYRFASIYEALEPFFTSDHAIFVNGAAALKSPLWLQVIADTLGRPLAALDADAEASARGAAIAALETVGALPSIRPEAPSVQRRFEPDMDAHALYHRGYARQATLEHALQEFWTAS